MTYTASAAPSLRSYSNADRKRILNLYGRHIKEYGVYHPGAVGWSSEFSKNIRFEILCQISNMDNRSILDVGCGFGDLYNFLAKRYHNFAYQGMDINPAMIEAARARYPEIPFLTMDFGEYQGQRFDYVLASGALSFKVPDYKQLYFGYIEKMFTLSKLGTAFNMLNFDYHRDDDTFATYSIAEVHEFCSSLTKNVVVRRDYLQHDFTFFIYH